MASSSDSTTEQPASKPGRRKFFSLLTYGVGVVAAALVGIPFVGFLFGGRKAPVKWVVLGPVADFPLNETRLVNFDSPLGRPWDGMVAFTGVHVRYQGREETETDEGKGHKFLVLAINCAHLGCPVEWFAESGLFMCPCHGGVYNANGEHASGPPPRGLFPCVYRVTRVRGLDLLEIQAPHFPTLNNTELHPA
jgi:menaquinol-cytochrome c reductase iron-sulfur subunit